MADVVRLPQRGTRNRRHFEVRAKTENVKRLPRRQLRVLSAQADLDEALAGDVQRPKTRADCVNGPRPCPWVGCRFNLFLDVNRSTGAIKWNRPELEPDEMPADGSCLLDLAERGGMTLDEIARVMNITREGVRQIEVKGIESVSRRGGKDLAEYADAPPGKPSSKSSGVHESRRREAPPVPPAADERDDDLDPDQDPAVERWANEVCAEFRAGMPLHKAWRLANEDSEGLGKEDAPVSLLGDAKEQHGPVLEQGAEGNTGRVLAVVGLSHGERVRQVPTRLHEGQQPPDDARPSRSLGADVRTDPGPDVRVSPLRQSTVLQPGAPISRDGGGQQLGHGSQGASGGGHAAQADQDRGRGRAVDAGPGDDVFGDLTEARSFARDGEGRDSQYRRLRPELVTPADDPPCRCSHPRSGHIAGLVCRQCRCQSFAMAAPHVASARPAPVTPKEEPMPVPMKPENVAIREKIVAALKLNGPSHARDIIPSLGCSQGIAKHVWRTLVADGTCEAVGWAQNAKWQLVGDKRAGAPSAPKPAATKPARATAPVARAPKSRAKVTAVAVEATGSGAVTAALEALRVALTQEHEQKMNAIATLLGGSK